MEHYCNVLHEIYPSGLWKGKYTINYTKCLLFDINQTSILFKKENTKVEQSGSEHLYVSSKIGINCRDNLALAPQGSKRYIFVTSFTQKMLECSDSMYFSIFIMVVFYMMP